VSELLLGTAALRAFISKGPTLHGWLDQREGEDHLHVTTFSIGEVLAQAEAKQDVQQRRRWIEVLTQEIPADFGPRLHSYDLSAAKRWSAIRASLGKTLPDGLNPYDLAIVAVALEKDLDYIAPREAWHGQVGGLRQHDVWTRTSYPT
jgi:predicted nucleic acid-binding protein